VDPWAGLQSSEVVVENETHLEILKRSGVAGWNQWRKENPQISPAFRRESLYALFCERRLTREGKPKPLAKGERAKLSGINLAGANLSGAFLEYVSLSGADLTRANLEGANLTDANLAGARLDGAILRDANLRRANLTNAKLLDANLMYTQLNGANLAGADLSDCNIYGVSAWNVEIDRQTIQSRLRIENYGEASIRVDDLELAQFIHLLLSRKKVRNVIDAMTARGVLLLGRFGSGGLEVLETVAAKLREEQYLPIIFDFDRSANRNYTETVKTLVGLARFVVVDLSGPSVPHELHATVPHYMLPFVPILEKGRSQYSMFTDILQYPWVIKPVVSFESLEDLKQQIPAGIIAPAERECTNRQVMLNQLFARS
jgi:uncharacterized protein YjbI with pentapeptide repeats